MKIALVGYGKMGQTIERLASAKGHTIVARLNETPSAENLQDAEVCIEFSQPEAAVENIKNALALGCPVVSGTTGWLHDFPIIEDAVVQKGGKFLYGSNFSLGVNLFFALTAYATRLLQPYEKYSASLSETHHIHKKDAPSGTAISVAEIVIKSAASRYENWALGKTNVPSQLPIEAIREDEVPGTHELFFRSEVDEISLKHTAFTRDGFAAGAILAAEWLVQQQTSGVYSMQDVLQLPSF